MMAARRPEKQARNWFFVVDEEFAEQVCSVPWRKHKSGYLMGRPDGYLVTLHRYIWGLAGNPDCPTIDHINRVPWDNRLCNLRAASRRLQALNTKARKSPVTGLPRGVVLARNCNANRYEARGTVQGKIIILGRFPTIEDARRVYEDWYQKELEKETNDHR